MIKKIKLYQLIVFVISSFLLAFIIGCDDSGVEQKQDVQNPDVRAFDSVGVEENVNASSFSGMNLLNGTTVLRDSVSKDVTLADTNSTGTGFYLRAGDLLDLNNPVAGFQTRFNRIYGNMSAANFDTITVLPVGRDTILPSLDFTADDTRFLGEYFEPNLTGNQPVYSFYLLGKSMNFHGKNIFGILQARESSDSNPGVIGGFRMSFRVKINFNGKNDFRKIIPGS